MRALAVGLACGALLVAPAGAVALPILAEPDAAELAQVLADAEGVQGVCYGWGVTVEDPTGEFAGEELGSSRDGPGSIASLGACERYVLLTGRVTYTSETSEFEDSADVNVETNLEPPVGADALERLGLGAERLLEESDDENLTSMVEALPLLVAETGAAPFVPFEPRTTPLPPEERPTGTPGSDWLRTYWPALVLMVLGGLLAAGLLVALVLHLLRRRRAARPPRPVPTQPPEGTP